MKVREYELTYQHQTIDMPIGASALGVGIKGKAVVLWMLTDDNSEVESRRFCLLPNEYQIPTPSVYVGTVQVGPIFLHAWEAL